MVDALFWWTGAAFWACVAVLLALLLYEILACYVVAADLIRWCMRCAAVEGDRWLWWHPFAAWSRQGWEFVRQGRHGTTFSKASGHWPGFRQGYIHPDFHERKARRAAQAAGITEQRE